MFFYTHVITDLKQETTSSGFLSAGLSSGKTFISAGLYSASDIASDTFNTVSAREVYSYLYGTYPRSVGEIVVSSTLEITNVLDSLGFLIEDTFGLPPDGSSTGEDSITYTISPTSTYQFSQSFSVIGSGTDTTFISGTASATKTTTGSSTVTLENVTTLVPVFHISMPTVRRWYVAREIPSTTPRAVAIAFAATHTSGTAVISRLSDGSNSFASDLSYGTSSSSSSDTVNDAETGSTFITGKQMSQTNYRATGIVSALRKVLVGNGVISSNSIAGEITFDPTISEDWTSGASVSPNLISFSIFTQEKSSSDTSGGTTYAWSYQSSSWRLYATTSNSSTSSSYSIAYGTSGSASTTTQNATKSIGVTTAILGPKIPLTISSFNQLSVSTRFTGSSGASAVFSSFNESSASSVSTSYSGSSSTTIDFGSGTSPAPVTYENSLLSWYVANVVASISTQTVSGYPNGSIPSLFKASKWNEASRGDSVSVVE
jgi:hypothetical protein